MNNSGNSNNNININISKKDFFINIKSEKNTKKIITENGDFFVSKNARYMLTKEQKRKIKIVFKKILTMT